jgi:hypothetical protein
MPPTELATYFTAERQGGFFLVALALVSFGFAAALWANRSAFVAMAWPLLVLGSVQLVIGLVVALRTPAQVASLEQGLRTSSATTVTAEIQRMTKVTTNFRVVKVVEAAVIVVGLVLVLGLPHPGTWPSVGLGLLVEAAVLLAFDAFAHQRALVYTRWLRGLGS